MCTGIIYIYLYGYVCIFVYIYTHTYSGCLCICGGVYMRVYIHTYVRTHTHQQTLPANTHTHTHTQTQSKGRGGRDVQIQNFHAWALVGLLSCSANAADPVFATCFGSSIWQGAILQLRLSQAKHPSPISSSQPHPLQREEIDDARATFFRAGLQQCDNLQAAHRRTFRAWRVLEQKCACHIGIPLPTLVKQLWWCLAVCAKPGLEMRFKILSAHTSWGRDPLHQLEWQRSNLHASRSVQWTINPLRRAVWFKRTC